MKVVDQQMKVLSAFLPEAACAHCSDILAESAVSVAIHRGRSSKWGDFRIRPGRPYCITVNGDLPKPFFLLTLIHEIAHLRVHLRYGVRNTAPHGKEWKLCFAELMDVFLSDDDVFGELTTVIKAHMLNPRANATTDQALYRAYLAERGDERKRVESLEAGTLFTYRKRHFKVKDKVRKRIACECQATQRTFLFQPTTPVEAL